MNRARTALSDLPRPASPASPVNLLPGPVALHESVWQAFIAPPLAHRSAAFAALLGALKHDLCALTQANHVQLMMGSGTLANDAIAAQLARSGGHGLVLSNGEFGERLCDAASRAGASFRTLRCTWGEPFDLEDIERTLRHDRPRWLWATHCETSTGMLNPAQALLDLCRSHGAELCLDCISSIGTLPLDLSCVWFASASSGKALGSLCGVGLVFHRETIAACPTLPRALDLGFYAECDGVPFTQSSNLIAALRIATERSLNPERQRTNAACISWLRRELASAGFSLVTPDLHASPAVLTLALPPHLPSRAVSEHLAREGFLVAVESDYLRKRNWMQLCAMGELAQEQLSALPSVLSEFCRVPHDLCAL